MINQGSISTKLTHQAFNQMKQAQNDAAAIYIAANKQPKEENDLKRLMDFTATLTFFIQINKRYGNTRIQRLFCQNMTILKVPSHHVIFKKGDEGDAFFLVLEGAVSIINKESNSAFSITKVVEKGLFFGELAIINGKKRSATAQNGANVAYLACIHKNSFRLVFASIFEDVFLHTYFSAIDGCFVFANWTRKDITSFFSSSFLIEVRFGTVLLRQHEIQADGILIVLSGKIQLFQSFYQEEIPLITLSANDVLNEEQFTDSSSPPLYTSKCISPSAKLLFINNDDFYGKILPDTTIYSTLMNQIVKKQMQLKNRLSEIEQGFTSITPVSKISPLHVQITKKPQGGSSRAAKTEPSLFHDYDNINPYIGESSSFKQDYQIHLPVSSIVASPKVKEAINLVSTEEEQFCANDHRQSIDDHSNYQGPLSPVKMRYMEAIRKKTLESVDPTVVCTMQSRKSLEDYKKILKVKINELAEDDDQQRHSMPPSQWQPPAIGDSSIKPTQLIYKKSLSLEKPQNSYESVVLNAFSNPRDQQDQTKENAVNNSNQDKFHNQERLNSKGKLLLLSPNLDQHHMNRLATQPPQIIVDSLNSLPPDDDRSRVHNSYLSIASSIDRQNNMEFLVEEVEEEIKQETDYSTKTKKKDHFVKETYPCNHSQEKQSQVSSLRSNQSKLLGQQDSILKSLINLEKCSENLFSQMSIQSSVYLKTSQNQARADEQQYHQTQTEQSQMKVLENAHNYNNTKQNEHQYIDIQHKINITNSNSNNIVQKQLSNKLQNSSNNYKQQAQDHSKQPDTRLFLMNQTAYKQVPSHNKDATHQEKVQQQNHQQNDAFNNDKNTLNKGTKTAINDKNSIKKHDLNFTGPNVLRLKTEENQNPIQRNTDMFRKSDSGGIISSAIHSTIKPLQQGHSNNYSAVIKHGHTAYSSPIQSLPQTSTPTEYSEYFQKPATVLKKQIYPTSKQSQPLSQVLKGDQKSSSNYLSSSSISSLLRPRVRPDCTVSSSVSSVGVNLKPDECVDNNNKSTSTSSCFFKKVGSAGSVYSTIQKNNYLQTSSHCPSSTSQNRSPLIRKLSHASQVISSFNHTASNSGNTSAQKLRTDESVKIYAHPTVGQHMKRGSVDVNNQNQHLQTSLVQEVRRQSQPDMRNGSSQKELSKSQSAGTTTNSQTNLISNSKQYKHAQARQRECENIDLAMQLYYKKTQQKKKDLMNSSSLDSSIAHPLSLSRPEIKNHLNNTNINQTTNNHAGLINDHMNSQQTKQQIIQNSNSPKEFDSILSQLLVEDVPLSKQPLLEQLQQNRKNSGVLNIKRIIYSQALSASEQPDKNNPEINENSATTNQPSSSSSLNLAWKIYSKRVSQEE